MRLIQLLSISLCFLFAGALPKAQAQAGEWRILFNGNNLQHWETYLSKPHPDINIEGLPRKEQGVLNKAFGVNYDPLDVFSVVMEDGKPAIRISGQVFGALTSLDSFTNYHLRLQFKWGKEKWPPRATDKRDSGILYHAFGEHGAEGNSWMKSQEFQIQRGDVGDYWAVGGTTMDIPARPKGKDSTYVYTPDGNLVTFSDGLPAGRHCSIKAGNEKTVGEWNTLDLYVHGQTAVHVVNGKVVMVLRNSLYLGEDNQKSLTEGRIQIQSEGAEVFYRDIRLRSIDGIPDDMLN